MQGRRVAGHEPNVRIITRDQIARALAHVDAIAAMERAFVSYSSGAARVPPVSEILFDAPPGEAHIKAGYIEGDAMFAVKVATGFYRNSRRGLPSGSGLITLFDAETGFPAAVLLDFGLLTDIRTAAAGAVAAKYLAPSHAERIAILGTGAQARLQARYLWDVTACRSVTIWGRSRRSAEIAAADIAKLGFETNMAPDAASAVRDAQIVVTTTPSPSPLFAAEDISPGTHITAVGADSEGKQEIPPDLFLKADIVAADSRAQAMSRGDLRHALRSGTVTKERISELGELIGAPPVRRSHAQISIADLTGVATQDIEIAKAVFAALEA